MAAVSSFQYDRAEAVRDAMIMLKSTSDFVTGLMALRNLNLPSVKRLATPNPLGTGVELTALLIPTYL
jgi:hypothetical protein